MFKRFNLLILLFIFLLLYYSCASDGGGNTSEVSTNDESSSESLNSDEPVLPPDILPPVDSRLEITAPDRKYSVVTVIGLDGVYNVEEEDQIEEASLLIRNLDVESDDITVLITNENTGEEISVPLIDDDPYQFVGYINGEKDDIISVRFVVDEVLGPLSIKPVPAVYLWNIDPEEAQTGDLVSIIGTGFSDDTYENEIHFLSYTVFPDAVGEYSDSIIFGAQVIEKTVPETASPGAGTVTVETNGEVSNGIEFEIAETASPAESVEVVDVIPIDLDSTVFVKD